MGLFIFNSIERYFSLLLRLLPHLDSPIQLTANHQPIDSVPSTDIGNDILMSIDSLQYFFANKSEYGNMFQLYSPESRPSAQEKPLRSDHTINHQFLETLTDLFLRFD